MEEKRTVKAHELWHILVLASTLFGAAGAVLLLLAPLVFGSTPPGLVRARPIIVGLVALAAAVFLGEWLVVH
jgi:hypothetical protein